MVRRKQKQSTEPAVEAQPALTEWQKRHLEFQQRKRMRQAAEEKKVSEPAMTSEGEQGPESPNQGANPETEDMLKTEVAPPAGLAKALLVLLLASMTLIASLLLISPWSKEKQFVVTGLVHMTKEEVLSKSGIPQDAYISQVALHPEPYEKTLVSQLPWVKSAKVTYQFPNRFTISLEEYGVVAYNWTEAGYAPILESGEQVAPLEDKALPETALPLHFTNTKDTELFIKQFVGLDAEVRQSVTEVTFANSASTPDLLLLTMVEGHTVRVPLSELSLKLPYYKTIKNKLSLPQIIDMEVGIYTTTTELETLASETKASKAEAAKTAEVSTGTPRPQTRTETSSSSDP